MAVQITTNPVDFNIDPFFDDFDETKNYLRLLFKPGVGLQARELTQIQTTLQNQIQKFGRHIFKENAPVAGGEITVHNSKYTITYDPTNAGHTAVFTDTNGVVLGNIIGAAVVDTIYNPSTHTGGNFEVRIDQIDVINHKILVSLLNGTIPNNSVIRLYNTDSSGIVTTSIGDIYSTAIDHSLTAHVNSGIIFSQGFFSYIQEQQIVIESAIAIDAVTNTTTGNYQVGFIVDDLIVDENDDSTLFDPATGSYNYQAPGAARYKQDVQLVSAKMTTNVDGTQTPVFDSTITTAQQEKFIPVVIVENGKLAIGQRKNKYADIEDLVAQRTYEESGNYVAEPFDAVFSQNTADETKLNFSVGGGTVYVFGKRVEIFDQKHFVLDKSRTKTLENNKTSHLIFGPSFEVEQIFDSATNTIKDNIGYSIYGVAGTTPAGFFNVAGKEKVNFYDAQGKTLKDRNGSPLVARIASVTRSLNGRMTISLLGVKSNLKGKFRSTSYVVGLDSGFWCKTYIDTLVKQPLLLDSTKPARIFEISNSLSVANVISNTLSQTYTTTISVTLDAAGSAIIPTPNGSATIDGLISVTNTTSGFIVVSSNNTASQITINAGAGFAGVTVLATIQVTESGVSFRTKNLLTVTDSITWNGGIANLSQYDGLDIVSVSNTSRGGTNIPVSNFTFGNGQTDTTYDLTSIRPSSVFNTSLVSNGETLSVTYRYFSHGTGGNFFSVDSYMSTANLAIEPNLYSLVKKYIASTGEEYTLFNSLDFRVNDVSANVISGLSDLTNIINDTNITYDFNFYLSRVDVLFVTNSGQIQIKPGIPAKTPLPVQIQIDEGYGLFELVFEPYTATEKNVEILQIGQRGFSMGDIQTLNDRLTDIETITSMTLLEQDTKALNIKDTAGLNKFKTGIFVDSFKNHMLGQIDDPEYDCAMDPEQGILRGQFNVDGVDLIPNIGLSTNVFINPSNSFAMKGISASNIVVVEQLKASNTIAVNPYAVFSWNGYVKLTPSADAWTNIVYAPASYVTTGSWAGAGTTSTIWNGWQTISVTRRYVAPPFVYRRWRCNS